MKGERYDHIFLDANALLYPIADTTVDPIQIAKLLLEVSREYHSMFGGDVHIYLDGPAHMGKIRHQRLRRFRYSPMTVRENPDGTIGLWSQAIFTPGTPQMNTINEFVHDHIGEYPGVSSFSSSDEPGEGEHKLVRDAKKLPTNMRIAMVGKDADLILLGMGMESHNVTILRHWNEKEENTYKASEDMQHINCRLLRSSILTESKSSSIWNFIISTFVIGNDFIPPVPECSDIFKVLPRIMKKRIRVYDERTRSIHWNGLINLLKELQGYQIDERWVGKVSDSSIFNTLYYTKYFPFPVDEYKLVQQWFITIEWIFQYYNNGMEFASRSWQYNTSVSPSLSTILSVGMRGVNGLELATEQVPPLLPTQALAAALPPWLHRLLPEEQRRNVKAYPEYYPLSFKDLDVLDYPQIPTIPYSVVSTL